MAAQGPRVAIVGSGPSGFYAAEALLNAGRGIAVDMYERLPVPFGLVRFGVAPDHARLKSVTSVFTRIGQSEGFRYVGNVAIGGDIGIDDLRRYYHAVIVACGAEREKALGIPGETLAGSYSAREFVAWYNGHPDYRDLAVDLSAETAVVIGHGNVSLDAARILLKPVDELARTDIADHTLEVLAESRIRKVHIVGRRGPAQAKFTSKELREFGMFEICDTIVDPADLQLAEACAAEIAAPANMIAKSNTELMNSFRHAPAGAYRQCYFDFYRSPIRLDGVNGRVASVTFERTRLDGAPFRQARSALVIWRRSTAAWSFAASATRCENWLGFRSIPAPAHSTTIAGGFYVMEHWTKGSTRSDGPNGGQVEPSGRTGATASPPSPLCWPTCRR